MPDDFKLGVRVSLGDTYEWSQVLLAKAHLDGTLELLTAAWERLLGFMGYRKPAATAAVAAILDDQNMAPVDLKLHCRDGRDKSLRLHRRFDPYSHKMYIVAEEAPENESAANAGVLTPLAQSAG